MDGMSRPSHHDYVCKYAIACDCENYEKKRLQKGNQSQNTLFSRLLIKNLQENL